MFNVVMDIYQHRRARLSALIDDQFDGRRVDFCDASGWSESRISQLLSPTYRNGQAFTEKTARKLEGDLKIAPMYFDQGAIPRAVNSQSDDDAGSQDHIHRLNNEELRLITLFRCTDARGRESIMREAAVALKVMSLGVARNKSQ